MALKPDPQAAMVVEDSNSSSSSPEPMFTADVPCADDGPIDLSRSKVDEARHVPPLIPINRALLRKRWVGQNDGNPPDSLPTAGRSGKKRRAHAMSASDSSRDSEQWDFRLDRAQSVPHLRTLSPSARCKSLSESRIGPAHTDKPALQQRPVDWLFVEHEQEIQRQRLQHMQLGFAGLQATENVVEEPPRGHNYDSLLRTGYYTQMLQCFQAQEMLRRFALQQHEPRKEGKPAALGAAVEDSPPQPMTLHEETLGEVAEGNLSGDDERGTSGTDENTLRGRSGKPLTGKHVRSGTGASPATLLTLRKKIQERQNQRARTTSK